MKQYDFDRKKRRVMTEEYGDEYEDFVVLDLSRDSKEESGEDSEDESEEEYGKTYEIPRPRRKVKPRRRGSSFSDALLLVFVLAFFGFLIIYGYNLKAADYKIPGKEEDMSLTGVVANAIISVKDGIYPWNYREIMAEKNALYAKIYGTAGQEESSQTGEVPDGEAREAGHEYEENPDQTVSDTDDTGENPADEGDGEPAEEGPVEVKYMRVGDEYFEDAVFLGDSRVVGLALYSGMETCTFYAKTSLTIYKLMDSSADTEPITTIREALMTNEFKKIYIQVGINELGTGDLEYFITQYQSVIDEIRLLQPDAIIYINSILHVTEARDKQGDYINNQVIDERNEALSQLANDVDVFYIDVNPVLDDDEGNLRQDLSWDNVHLTANSYPMWYEFLKDHAIDLVGMGLKDPSETEDTGEPVDVPEDSAEEDTEDNAEEITEDNPEDTDDSN